jgi:hypothetical protein
MTGTPPRKGWSVFLLVIGMSFLVVFIATWSEETHFVVRWARVLLGKSLVVSGVRVLVLRDR